RNLTLRDPAALEALANAVEHLHANEDLELRFCYLTNATVGRERLCTFPGRTPGVTLWERIRRRELPAEEAPAALQSLRQFLRNLARPEKVSEELWDAFQTFLQPADEDGFANLVCRFEWSTAHTPSSAYSQELRDTLIERGLATTQEAAQFLY